MNGLDIVARVSAGLACGMMMFNLMLNIGAMLGEVDRRFAQDMHDRLRLPIGICWLVDATATAAQHDWLTSGIAIVLGALVLRDWWNRRGRKLASKLTAKVRDLGHRLTVVPIPGGA